MQLYFAPMEGVSGYVHRNAHKAYFGHIDKYFAPFIVADLTMGMNTKSLNDILKSNNPDIRLIPQILSNNGKEFCHTARRMKQHGYDEINLNLGCPSRIVASKNRGSAFLAMKKELNTFLEEIFSDAVTEISIKTRAGKEQHDEFYELIEIFNQFPVKELIIHPRVQTDLYRNKPDLDIFKDALKLCKMPVCYNGDIFTLQDFEAVHAAFPEVDTFMLGRGILTNPGLADLIAARKRIDKADLEGFHAQLYRGYQETLIEERKILCKMKETWFYMSQIFTSYEPYLNEIRRSLTLETYEHAVSRLFEEQVLADDRQGYSF